MTQFENIINTPVEPKYSAPQAGYRNWIVDSIKCADGTQLSVQASRGHYCLPRGDEAPYYAVEVGYPTADPGPEWLEYKDSQSKPGFNDVYGYVPVELVQAFISAHGGEAA